MYITHKIVIQFYMLTSFFTVIDFFKNLSFTQVKETVIDFFMYLWNLLKGIYEDVKTNNGNFIMFIAWFLVSIVFGFTFSILAMIVHSCYVHHMQDDSCNICNHEDILKYTLLICLGGILHVFF